MEILITKVQKFTVMALAVMLVVVMILPRCIWVY